MAATSPGGNVYPAAKLLKSSKPTQKRIHRLSQSHQKDIRDTKAISMECVSYVMMMQNPCLRDPFSHPMKTVIPERLSKDLAGGRYIFDTIAQLLE
ncbi:hypothetical protein TMEN_6225 [Trichophyton mentagrophytes]|nr:hypothetical protein TMEN_6225 [Trichophyton mentagrophytes]